MSEDICHLCKLNAKTSNFLKTWNFCTFLYKCCTNDLMTGRTDIKNINSCVDRTKQMSGHFFKEANDV